MHNWLKDLPQRDAARTVLVVDGGATRSRAIVADRDGTTLAYAEGRPTNARAVGDALALDNLTSVVRTASKEADAEVEYCLVMSAAVDTVAHARLFGSALERELGTRAVAVLPDGIGPWAVSNGLQPAVGVIAGTGSVALAASLEPPLYRRYGGWDFMLGDEGSGFAVGRDVIRMTLLTDEGRASAEALVEATLEALGVATVDEVMDRVHKPTIDKALVASLTVVAFRLAEIGDPVATRIVREQVGFLVDTACKASIDLGTPDHPVALVGGLFESDVYRNEFARQWAGSAQGQRELRRPRGASLEGGVALALARCGLPRTDAVAAATRVGDAMGRETQKN